MAESRCLGGMCPKPIKVKSRGLCAMHDARRRRCGDAQAHRPARDDRRPDGALWCSRCETHKHRDEFHRNHGTKTGRDGVCAACVNQRRADAAEHRTAVRRAYRDRNRDRINAYKRATWPLDSPRHTEYNREWRRANPDRLRAQIRAQNAARYARNRNAPGHASASQIAARWAYYGDRCWMCTAPATDTDHVKPLARGGSNWPANLRPACSTCNRSKSDRWPLAVDEGVAA